MAQIYFSQLCECQCGKTVISTDRRLSRRRRFVKGHNSKLLSAELAKRPAQPPRPSAGPCECGCGTPLSTEPRFIKGHNARLTNTTHSLAGGRGKILRPDDPRGPNPSGLCQCACGKPVPITFDSHKGRVTGCYARFLKGHDKITVKQIGGNGKCFCGCGRDTPISKQTRLGNIEGQPQMYYPGHRWRAEYSVNAVTGCWELPANKTHGYSRIRRNGRLYLGHRWYWEQLNGPIPETMTLDHLCRVRACCNPDHMEVVSGAENSRRVFNHPEIPKWGDWNERDIVVDPATGCWLFPITQTDGYARFWIKTHLITAHRFYYQRAGHRIPADLQLDHLCRCRNCVNPLHLEPVTRAENMKRAADFKARRIL